MGQVRKLETRQYLLIAVPAIFDLAATALNLVGLILLPASVWQMLWGAQTVFAALLTVLVLGRRLYAFHWIGVMLALAGITCVGTASVFSMHEAASTPNDQEHAENAESFTGVTDASLAAVGVIVTTIAQALQAAQVIAEEKLMCEVEMTPILVVGVEGVWGLFIMSVIVYPVLWALPGHDSGSLENPLDTVEIMKSSSSIQMVVVLRVLSCAMYNVMALRITQDMSGMMNVMLEATRTICVWIFNLIWHYYVNDRSNFGEPWTHWSYLEGMGFLLLILGQTAYSEILKLPGFAYPTPTSLPPPIGDASQKLTKSSCSRTAEGSAESEGNTTEELISSLE